MDLDLYFQIVQDKTQHKTLVIWACDCAERVLNIFEKEYPVDNNPREAILSGRLWLEGKLNVADARKNAFASHNSARNSSILSATYAARSAGHACATVHVATHAIYAIKYALKAIKSDSLKSEITILEEQKWQNNHLNELLKQI